MESVVKPKKSFDLYDYVGPGKSLYDVLAKTGLYDASTEAMLTCAPAVSDAFPSQHFDDAVALYTLHRQRIPESLLYGREFSGTGLDLPPVSAGNTGGCGRSNRRAAGYCAF